jgi:hypothetical protein
LYLSDNISNGNTLETPGQLIDLSFLHKDSWLINTEVRYHLQKKKGLWELNMVYIAIENPIKFLLKKIDVYSSEKKAIIFAKILQRGIRKDARGTLKSDRNAFNICAN